MKKLELLVKNLKTEKYISKKAENLFNAKKPIVKNENSIPIFGYIGEDYWADYPNTADRIRAALSRIGDKPVELIINSQGGDMFEGIAIYNILKDHPHEVTVKIIGLAASAASIIAMAGDKILMGDASFLMIHNAWALVAGDKNELRKTADIFDMFDEEIAKLYVKKTNKKLNEIVKMMNEETFMGADAALESGFIDGKTDGPIETEEDRAAKNVSAKLDKHLDMTRAEKRKLYSEIKQACTQDATSEQKDTQDAVEVKIPEPFHKLNFDFTFTKE